MNRLGVLCLVALIGCDHGTGQPVVRDPLSHVVDPQPLVAPREEVLDPDPSPDVPSLADTTNLDGLVTVQPGDLMTATWRSSPSIVLGPRTEEAERLLREPGRVRLRGYPDGESVPFTWREGSDGYGGQTRYLSMELSRPLEPRWYAIEFDLPVSVQGAKAQGGVQVARFRPDSHPVLQGVFAAERDGMHLIEARFSERVAGDVPASEWRLEDDNGALRCSVAGPARGAETQRVLWTCTRRDVGQVRIDFGGVLTNVSGVPVRSIDGRVLTDLAVEPTGATSSEGVRVLEPRDS